MESTNYLIDTHCHIHDNKYFNADPEQALIFAANNNVRQVILVGNTPTDSLIAQKFAAVHDNVFWSYGIHPSEAQQPAVANLDLSGTPWPVSPKIIASSDTRPDTLVPSDNLTPSAVDTGRCSVLPAPVAIGEIGLDYHYKPYNRPAQIALFERMLDLAARHHLPVIFHIREAFPDFFAIINNFPKIQGVVHSFSDSAKNLELSLEHGFYIGVNGLATFANLPTPPLERILLETDAPFLTPVPFRGKINTPGYVKNIAEWLSTKLGVSVATIATVTTQNARKCFNLRSPVFR